MENKAITILSIMLLVMGLGFFLFGLFKMEETITLLSLLILTCSSIVLYLSKINFPQNFPSNLKRKKD